MEWNKNMESIVIETPVVLQISFKH